MLGTGFKIGYNLLEVDGGHVLKDAAPEVLALVGHGAVLDGSVENDNIASLAGHLQSVGKKFLTVIWVSGKARQFFHSLRNNQQLTHLF